MKTAVIILFSFLIFSITSCENISERGGLFNFIPKEDRNFSKEAIEVLRAGENSKLENYFYYDLLIGNAKEQLLDLAKVFPKNQKLISIEELASRLNEKGGASHKVRTIDFKYKYNFEQDSVFVNIKIRERNSFKYVIKINAEASPLSKKLSNDVDSEIKFYVFLVLFIIVSFVILAAFFRCVTSNLFHKKFYWAVFILLGFFRITFFENTGKIDFHPLMLQILGANLFKIPNTSFWIVQISIPLGAVVFWVIYWVRRKNSN